MEKRTRLFRFSVIFSLPIAKKSKTLKAIKSVYLILTEVSG